MPTYEYECPDCGNVFEEVQKITAPALTDCPKCQGKHVHRIISATAFHLKGSGWYKTDYGSSGSSSSGRSSSGSSTSTPAADSSSSPAAGSSSSDSGSSGGDSSGGSTEKKACGPGCSCH